MDVADWVARRAAALRQVETWKNSVSIKVPAYPGGGYLIDIDGKRVVAQFIVWPSGSMEATVGAVEDGQVVYLEAAESLNESELEERWLRFYSAVLQVETSR